MDLKVIYEYVGMLTLELHAARSENNKLKQELAKLTDKPAKKTKVK